jgi:gentisate 1,2-dioxygenase
MAKSAQVDPHVGHALEFTNPADGGSIMPTISAHVRLIPAGFETKARRSSDGTIFVVCEGKAPSSSTVKKSSLRTRHLLRAFVEGGAFLCRHRPGPLCLFRQGFSGKAQPLPRMERLI